MNREILFKGKRIDNGEWVEGNVINDGVTGQYFIHKKGNSLNESDKINKDGCLMFVAFEVDLETVCQYTGLTDKNGNKIWSSDIVEIAGEDGYFLLDWSEDTAKFEMSQEGNPVLSVDFDNYWANEVEVISNIFDNPELLKEC